MRRALGASYGQVARLLLVESTLLGVAGGGLGLACAVGLLRVLLAFAPGQLPRMDMICVTGGPVGVATGMTLLAVLLFGMLPALAAARGNNLASGLRLDSRSGTWTRQGRRVRQSLVALHVALAVVLLAGAGLLVRSFQHFERLDLGYDTYNLWIVELAIPFVNYDSKPKHHTMFDELYQRLRAVPGVTALTPVLYRPFAGASLMQATPVLEGQSQAEADANPLVPLEVGGSEYFRAFQIPIPRGGGFLDSDRENAPKIVVVSEAVARRSWPGQDPIGKRLRLPGFGLVALLLGAIGLYGVMASTVRERTHEMGVRMALGATPERLRREVLGSALVVAAVGAAVGLGGALVGSRLLAALLFEVSPTDQATLGGVCILLLAVALMAAYVPARRANKVDPVQALRAG